MTTTLQSQLAEVLALGALACGAMSELSEDVAEESGNWPDRPRDEVFASVSLANYDAIAAFIAAACNLARSPELREALADALRYRFLRDRCNHRHIGLHIQFSSDMRDADAAIDAAMTAPALEGQ